MSLRRLRLLILILQPRADFVAVARDDGRAIFGCVLKFIFVVEHGLEKVYAWHVFFFDGFGKSFVDEFFKELLGRAVLSIEVEVLPSLRRLSL